MPSNVEIKARVKDFAALKVRAAAINDAPGEEVITQRDTFFTSPQGRLKLRVLHSNRTPGEGQQAQLIAYSRVDQSGPKRSDYMIYSCVEPDSLRSVLNMSMGILGEVKKVRHLFMVGQTRIHLDDVTGLGHFVELEVVLREGQSAAEGQEIAQGLMQQLGIEACDLLEGAYMDMLLTAAAS